MCKEDSKDSFRKPKELLEFAGLSDTDTVLDISAGFGYLTKNVAKTAHRVDAQNGSEWKELFESFGIQKQIDDMEANNANVHHFWSSFEDPAQSKTNEYDLVTCQNSFHDLYDLPVNRTQFFQSIHAAMKENGRFLLVDHCAGQGRGSDDTKELHRIEESTVRDELHANGFVISKTSDMFAYPKDDYTKPAWNEPNVNTDRLVFLCVKKTKTGDGEDADAETTKETNKSNKEQNHEEPPAKKPKET